MATPGYGPRVNGRDFNFFDRVSVSNYDFNEDADAIITFPLEHLSIFNEGLGVVEVSFNGNTIHAELNPNLGSANVTIHAQGISKIWFRLKSGGTSNIRIQSNSSIEPSTLSAALGGMPIQISGNSASADAFGRLRVANPFTIFESKQLFDNRSIVWDTQLVSGGTSTFNSNRASSLLEVTSTIGSSVLRQTKPRFNYQAGKSLLIMSTFVMGETPPGITKDLGYFDGYNGLFLRNDGYDVQFVIKSNVSGSPQETAIIQSDWNVDTFDGYGPSGIILDITKSQIFIIDLEWLGVGRVRFGFNIGGITYFAHQQFHANNLDSVYMSNPNLPLSYKIINDGYAGTSSLEQICNTVLSEGGFENKGYEFSADRGIGALANVDNAALYPIISIRLDNSKAGAVVIPEEFNILCTSTNAIFKWELVLNPTVGGADAASWQSITNSSVQYDISRTLTNIISGGTVLKSGYASQTTGAVQIAIESLLTLGININNVSDQLVLAVQKIAAGTDNFIGSISWKEFV